LPNSKKISFSDAKEKILNQRAAESVNALIVGIKSKIPVKIDTELLAKIETIEKAESVIDEEKAKELEKKIAEQRGLTLDDFLDQLQQIKKMGSLDQLMDMIPWHGLQIKLGVMGR